MSIREALNSHSSRALAKVGRKVRCVRTLLHGPQLDGDVVAAARAVAGADRLGAVDTLVEVEWGEGFWIGEVAAGECGPAQRDFFCAGVLIFTRAAIVGDDLVGCAVDLQHRDWGCEGATGGVAERSAGEAGNGD